MYYVKRMKDKALWKMFLTYTTLFLIIWFSFWLYNDTGANMDQFQNGQFFFLIIIGIVLILIWCPNYSIKYFISLIMGTGIFMRIIYMLQTSYNERVHDLGLPGLAAKGNTGHAGYIYTIFATGQLPDSNEWQLYHPPFYHWLCAQALKLFQIFHPDEDPMAFFGVTKVVSCFASCATLFIIKQICEELKLSERSKIIIIALMAFFPNYYLLAGRVNNDSLVIMFVMLIILYTIRWYYNPTLGNIVGIALGFGFGMMTKINAGTMAFLVGPLFLYKLYKMWKEKKQKQYLIQYVVFSLISFSLGLWYPIRNFIEFSQPFQYVLKMDQNNILGRAGVSAAKRFLPEFGHLLEPVYTEVYTDYNIPLYIVKSSMFGEFKFEHVDFAARVLLVVNLLLILISLAAMAYILVSKKEKNYFMKWGIFAVWALSMLTYISFNITYPFSCTMDYRYIVPTCFTGAVFMGILFERLLEKKSKITYVLAIGIAGLVSCFSIASVYIFCIV